MKSISLGPLEQEIMKCVWQNKSCTARDVHNILKSNKKIAYNTIQTIMTRLVAKNLLKRNLKGRTHEYQAKQKQKNILQSAINKSMSGFINQFGEDALIAFFDGLDNISPKTRQKLIEKLQSNE